MLEQIDKDVRRTLPDFAFFQLPIPYSALCPLSIEPKKRTPKKKASKKQSSASIASAATIGSVATIESAATIGSAATIESTGTTESTETMDATAVKSTEPTGLIRGTGTSQRQRTLHCSSLDMKWTTITRTTTPTLKRRQTVTVTSPMAGKKAGQWKKKAPPTLTVDSGSEKHTLSTLNGTGTPSDLSSPAPSRLRDVAASGNEAADDDDMNQEEEGEEDQEESELPDYLFSPIPTRRSLFKRVAHLNQDFGSRQHQPHSLKASRSKDSWSKKRQNAQNAESQESGDPSLSTSPSSSEDSDDSSLDDELPQDLHWEAIERILFIYAKLNPGVGYVQGMNEILGPLYYLLANDTDETSRGLFNAPLSALMAIIVLCVCGCVRKSDVMLMDTSPWHYSTRRSRILLALPLAHGAFSRSLCEVAGSRSDKRYWIIHSTHELSTKAV